jgi:hypothetical protein
MRLFSRRSARPGAGEDVVPSAVDPTSDHSENSPELSGPLGAAHPAQPLSAVEALPTSRELAGRPLSPLAPVELVPATRKLPAIVAGRWVRDEAYRRALALVNAAQATDLMSLSPGDFEREIARRLVVEGYPQAEVVGGSGDLGADIRGRDSRGRLFIAQCKRYAPHLRVRSADMQGFIGMIVRHDAERGLYFTTGGFTAQAQDLARHHDVEIYDGERLLGFGVDEVDPVEPPERLLAVLEREVREELLGSLVVGRIEDVQGPTALVRLADGREALLNSGRLDLPRFVNRQDPRCERLLKSLRGKTMRFIVDDDDELGDRLRVSRRRAAEIETLDERDQLLSGMNVGDTIRAIVTSIGPDGALAASFLGRFYIDVFLAKDWLSSQAVFRVEEYLEVACIYNVSIRHISREDLCIYCGLPE